MKLAAKFFIVCISSILTWAIEMTVEEKQDFDDMKSSILEMKEDINNLTE